MPVTLIHKIEPICKIEEDQRNIQIYIYSTRTKSSNTDINSVKKQYFLELIIITVLFLSLDIFLFLKIS